MEYRGASVYDEEDFFENFSKRRNRPESPNNAIEGPVLFELIGSVEGKKVLDLGCGDASISEELMAKGCQSYVGIEGSKRMAEAAAKTLEGTRSKVVMSTLEKWQPEEGAFDLVLSRFVLHYLSDLEELMKKVHSSLVPGGKFIFSVQHPVLTSSTRTAEAKEAKTDWIVDDYFNMGERKEPWIGKSVIKYHRTTEEYFLLVKSAGFSVEDTREGTPFPENFDLEEEYKRRKRIPIVLLFSCTK